MNVQESQIQNLFFEALDRDTGDDLDAFLRQLEASNPEAAVEVRSLLAAHDRAGQFLATDPEPIGLINDTESSTLGDKTIGAYRIDEKLGEGGFGVVYRAEQQSPIRRRVALKLIKPGMDSKQVLDRFRAEQQALSMMDHEHIARVLDAGVAENGRPYFVMELVDGLPITKFCQQRDLSTEERLKLFVDVCRAVQHAHQKGIIHRDIKPSNLLVAVQDNKPCVKVIDFGIAKALEGDLSEHTIFTQTGQILGTPMYMSPEQTQAPAVDVDTRSDVYSMGIVLYELLSGYKPFDDKHLRKVGPAEAQEIVRETEPVKPSDRVSTVHNEHRKAESDPPSIDFRKLRSRLRGDLDWVVMKAIDKDRERRYGSASEFADDIDRHLAGQPVKAGPPSTFYRTRKLVRRHRMALLATTFVLASMVAGTCFSIWYSLEAKAAKKQAELSERLANQRLVLLKEEQQKLREQTNKLQSQRDILAEAKKKSQQDFALARNAVSELIDQVASARLNVHPELANIREELLESGDKFYSVLIERNLSNAALFHARADLRRRLNRDAEALSDYLSAEKLAPASASLQLALSRFYLDTANSQLQDPELALRHAQHAVELQPTVQACWEQLAWAYGKGMKDAENASQAMRHAAGLYKRGMPRTLCLGMAFEFDGDYEKAAKEYRFVIVNTSDSQFLHQAYLRLGFCLIRLKQFEKAIESLTLAIEQDAYDHYAFMHRAEAHAGLKNYSAAIDDWRCAFELAPHQTDILGELLECLVQAKDYRGATDLFNSRTGSSGIDLEILDADRVMMVDKTADAELIDAKDRYLLRTLDQIALIEDSQVRRERSAELLAFLDEVIEKAGSAANHKTYELRADVRRRGLMEPGESLPDYLRAIELKPTSFSAYESAANAYLASGNLKDAFVMQHFAIELHPDPPISMWDDLARTAGSLRNFHAALVALKKDSRFQPRSWDAWELQGMLHLFGGDKEGYREVCETMLQKLIIAPTGHKDYAGFDGFLCSLVPGAISDYEPAIDKYRTDVERRPIHYGPTRALGGCLLRAGKYSEAEQVLKIGLDREWVTHRLLLAIAQHHLGKKTEAKETLDSSRKLHSALGGMNNIRPDGRWFHASLWNLLESEASQLIEARGVEELNGEHTNSGRRLEPLASTDELMAVHDRFVEQIIQVHRNGENYQEVVEFCHRLGMPARCVAILDEEVQQLPDLSTDVDPVKPLQSETLPPTEGDESSDAPLGETSVSTSRG